MNLDLKNRQHLLGLIAGVVIGLFITDKVILTPLTNSWKTRTKRIEELRQKVSDAQALVRREQVLRERWADMRANTLPTEASDAEQRMLKSFDSWARQSQAGLLSVSPQWKHDTDDYMTLECRVEAAGNLNSLSRFLYELERDPMALRLQAVELSSRDNDGQQLALGLQVSGLVLTPQPERVSTSSRKPATTR